MSKDAISRRTFLRATAGATATVAGATTAAAQEGGNGTSGNESSGNASAGNQTSGNASSGNQSSGNQSSGNQSSGGGGGGGGTETVQVGAGSDGLSFDPSDLTIQPGTTVVFEWVSNGHNVVPNEGDWGVQDIHDEGFSFEHTFEEETTYDYVCEPHEDAGMTGTIEVSSDAGSGGGGGGGGSSVPSVPDSAKSIGVATTFSMVATLGLGYFFIKYGGDYES